MANWLSWESAREITGHPTSRAVSIWVRRWNKRHPHQIIRTRRGYVERQALHDALDADAVAHTPALRHAKALESLERRRRHA